MSIVHDAKSLAKRSTITQRVSFVRALRNYTSLVDFLAAHGLSEKEVMVMIGLELLGLHRQSFLLKLHQRLCAIRRDRERRELTGV